MPADVQPAGQPRQWLHDAIATVFDLLVIAGCFWLLPRLVAQLTHGHWVNAVLIGAAYVLMCGGIVLARLTSPPRPQPAGEEERSDTAWCALGLAVPFGIFVMVMMMMAGGAYSEEAAWLDQLGRQLQDSPLLSVLGALLFLGIMLLFPAVLFIQPRRRLRAGPLPAALMHALGLAGVGAMVLITAAFWQAELADAEPMGLAIGGRILVFVASYAVFLMFYAPPRLAIISVAGGRWSLLSFLIMLGVIVWPLTA